MNRLLSFPLIALLALLAACGKEGEKAPPRNEKGTPASRGGRTPAGKNKEKKSEKKTSSALPSDKRTGAPHFARWVSTGKTEGYYQTAIAHYEDDKGRKVDLIGAVHLGDSGYFAQLNKIFTQYQALLYELVAKKGDLSKIKEKKTKTSFLSMIQHTMAEVLDLRFQLDGIDYEAKNFVHADIDPSTFLEKLAKKGLTPTTMMIQVMLRGMQQARKGKTAPVTSLHVLIGLLTEDPRYLKFLFAQQLGDLETMLANFGGEKGEESVIVGDRNKAAFKVLDEQLAQGKTKLGIYYGAAHLPNMHDLLLERGFHYLSSDWLMAWDCRLSPEQRARNKALEAKKLARRKAILERRAKRRKAALKHEK